jgi:hypothetical protein
MNIAGLVMMMMMMSRNFWRGNWKSLLCKTEISYLCTDVFVAKEFVLKKV